MDTLSTEPEVDRRTVGIPFANSSKATEEGSNVEDSLKKTKAIGSIVDVISSSSASLAFLGEHGSPITAMINIDGDTLRIESSGIDSISVRGEHRNTSRDSVSPESVSKNITEAVGAKRVLGNS